MHRYDAIHRSFEIYLNFSEKCSLEEIADIPCDIVVNVSSFYIVYTRDRLRYQAVNSLLKVYYLLQPRPRNVPIDIQ